MDNKCDLEFSTDCTATSYWLDSPYSEECRAILDLQYQLSRRTIEAYIEDVFFKF